MSDHYQYITVKTVKEDSAAIVAIMKRIFDRTLTSDIRLLNYYEEIPVNYPAVIDYIEDDMVDFSTHQHQAVVMQLEKKTILKSRHFPHEVIANVFRVDVNKSLVTLTNFAYVQVKAERRRYVRVTVKGNHEVIFTDGTRKLRGMLQDISLSGLAMICSEMADFDTMQDGTLLLSLTDKPISVEGRLVKVVNEIETKRFIFDFTILSRDENILSQFIFQRQVEIIKDLKDCIF